MNKIILLLVISTFSFVGFSQGKTHPNSFKIEKSSSSKKSQEYHSALAKANLEGYRLKDEDVVLRFEEGFTCLLFSARSLSENEIKVDIDSYKTKFSDGYELPLFSVSEGGAITATYQKAFK